MLGCFWICVDQHSPIFVQFPQLTGYSWLNTLASGRVHKLVFKVSLSIAVAESNLIE